MKTTLSKTEWPLRIGNGQLANALTALMGHITIHAEDYKDLTGMPSESLERVIKLLFTAREVIRDYVDPCDIPY